MTRAEFEALVVRLDARGDAELDETMAHDMERALGFARGADGLALADLVGSCARLRTLYGRYACSKELVEANALLARRTGIAGLADGEGGDFAGRSYARVRDLFEHIDFSACRALVMVGCGPLPVTLLHIAERTHVPWLIGLDLDPEAVTSARDVCRGLGLDRVEIRESEGCAFDYCNADVVYIANLVRPKRPVLCRVAETIRPGARVVVREPSAAGELLSERGADPSDPRWRVVGRGPEDPRFLSYHLFLERLGSAAQA